MTPANGVPQLSRYSVLEVYLFRFTLRHLLRRPASSQPNVRIRTLRLCLFLFLSLSGDVQIELSYDRNIHTSYTILVISSFYLNFLLSKMLNFDVRSERSCEFSSCITRPNKLISSFIITFSFSRVRARL